MPEGPEVRTVADKLATLLVGRFITQVWISPTVAVPITGDLQELVGCQISMVTSYGKKLLLHCENKVSMVAGLGMTGRFLYQPSNHSQIALQYGDSNQEVDSSTNWVFFEDSRHFGHINVCPTQYLPTLLGNIGPDLLASALTTEIDGQAWMSRFPLNSSRKIFEVIKDQSTVSGIGNYLASEILYYSAIHPLRQTKSLTVAEWEKLRVVSHQVIKLSYYHGGFTLESFISPDGMRGTYPAAVYGKQMDGQGYPVIKQKIGGQSAHFVPVVQIAPM